MAEGNDKPNVAVEEVDKQEQAPASVNQGEAAAPPMSKSMMKKLAKQERYLATKAERKAQEKAQKKEMKAAKKSERDEQFRNMTEEQRQAVKDENQAKRQGRKQESEQKREKMKASLAEGNQRLCIDLDFESYMVEGDQRHLCQQLSYSYSANCKVDRPCHLLLLGLKGGFGALIEKNLPGLAHWHVTKSEMTWQEYYKDKLNEIVYLTADSPNEIDDLDSTKVYVIGGLVDHNKHKGLCYKRAAAAGVATARLPINKHVKLETSCVLTVNHVVQLLVEFVNKKDWAAVLDDVLPKRKRADWRAAKRVWGSSEGGEKGGPGESEEGAGEGTEGGPDEPAAKVPRLGMDELKHEEDTGKQPMADESAQQGSQMQAT